MKIIRLNYGLIVLVLLSILFLSNESHFNPINNQDRNESPTPAQSQFSEGSLTVDQNFSLIETSENSGTQKNVSSVNINFDNSRWNITNLKINMTNMYFQKEIKTVVYQPDFSYLIDKTFPRIGVQFQINNPIVLYGVYIYGQNGSSISCNTMFQIQASKQDGSPDDSKIYGIPTLLNMSSSLNLTWHRQTFISPISLSKGTYYMVINASLILLALPQNQNKIKYTWWFNDLDPNYPTLNTSRYEKTAGWSSDYRYTGSPLLYKLIQRINQTFYPSQIKMTAKINGIDYNVQNGTKIGSGNLTVAFNNFYPNAPILSIPINNNLSEALIFNLSYYVKLNNSLVSSGSIEIKDGLDNKWTIEPNLERFGWNYSVSYKYPKPWKNIEVYRNSLKLFENTDYINSSNTLYILNKTFPDAFMSWEIVFNTTNIPINLNVPKLEWIVGQILEFSLLGSIISGNYTFILCDSNGFVKNNKLYINPNGGTIFNYTIPSNAVNGNWKAYIYWNNLTDAGVTTQIFLISGGNSAVILPSGDSGGNGKTEVTGLDPFLVFIIILIIGIVAASSFTSYATLKRIKNIRDIRRKKLFDKITNVLSLSHVIVIDKNSGLNVYEESYGGRNIDTTLVSGFLDAIRSFGIELTSARTQSQAISLEYQDSKILMAEFKSFRLILIMGEKASEEFLKSITNLSYDIDNNFGEELRNFNGDVAKFREIRNLIETHLNTAFIYPLTVIEPREIEPKKPLERLMIFKEKKFVSERAMILKAKKFMKENNLNYFFTSFLLSEQNLTPKEIETISKLLEKKIFQPIELTSQIK